MCFALDPQLVEASMRIDRYALHALLVVGTLALALVACEEKKPEAKPSTSAPAATATAHATATPAKAPAPAKPSEPGGGW
jgi:hypothetical protein